MGARDPAARGRLPPHRDGPPPVIKPTVECAQITRRCILRHTYTEHNEKSARRARTLTPRGWWWRRRGPTRPEPDQGSARARAAARMLARETQGGRRGAAGGWGGRGVEGGGRRTRPPRGSSAGRRTRSKGRPSTISRKVAQSIDSRSS